MVDKNKKSEKCSLPRDHMANERTFLAWVRTSIGIMAFGFVIERFALFIKQLAFLVGGEDTHVFQNSFTYRQTFSSIFGLCLVIFGMLICFFAFLNYKNVEKQIDKEKYQPSIILNIVTTLFVILIGIFLVLYFFYKF